MSETDIRYYLLPMVIVFILGIAAKNIADYFALHFFIIMGVAIGMGILIGGVHQLFLYLWKNFSWFGKKKKAAEQVQM